MHHDYNYHRLALVLTMVISIKGLTTVLAMGYHHVINSGLYMVIIIMVLKNTKLSKVSIILLLTLSLTILISIILWS
jgi:hypothetical protein